MIPPEKRQIRTLRTVNVDPMRSHAGWAILFEPAIPPRPIKNIRVSLLSINKSS
ncbi:unnamed protein product [Ciceribacter sp. T2.26MG-112.2]|uniref:Uncharacterized protein n=1 Tax=Ciceribacter selenitireducens ATCC BAA-1503 TaxID=1336235 RepID=A0A376AJR5_9HYPH|nr:unnamed protein product [Ciceribacter selenitireducens ATCC BAA-1503]SSC72291.1 unnamed protein product [Ciceribacter naphthalenivorans]